MYKERLFYAEYGRQRYITHLDITGKGQPAGCGEGRIKSPKTKTEGVAIEHPMLPQQVFPSPLPPVVNRFHLRVPDDVAIALGATECHRFGYMGDGVKVAMVDSGHSFHPFFAFHHYQVEPAITVVAGTDPRKDPEGHGTSQSANLFAIAPSAALQPIRVTDNQANYVGTLAGFIQAKQLSPAIITNSYGSDQPFPTIDPPSLTERVWAAEIMDAIEQGIFVVFAAGNSTVFIGPQVPGVLAAGGVFMSEGMELQASNYASGYQSPRYPGRIVPDLCGLCGHLPRAQYLLLPLPPGSKLDMEEHYFGDGTVNNDGWALLSGTSAAAPQIAGVAALILGAKPGVTPAQITEALTKTAVDVRMGHCSPRFDNFAGIGPDAATGHGLVNAGAAVQYALDRF